MTRYLRDKVTSKLSDNHSEIVVLLVVISIVLTLIVLLILCNCVSHCKWPRWGKKRERNRKKSCDCDEEYYEHVKRLLEKHQEMEEKRRWDRESLREDREGVRSINNLIKFTI